MENEKLFKGNAMADEMMELERALKQENLKKKRTRNTKT